MPIGFGEVTGFKHRFGQLLDKEWHTICLGNDLLEHLVGDGFPLGNACNNLLNLGM